MTNEDGMSTSGLAEAELRARRKLDTVLQRCADELSKVMEAYGPWRDSVLDLRGPELGVDEPLLDDAVVQRMTDQNPDDVVRTRESRLPQGVRCSANVLHRHRLIRRHLSTASMRTGQNG